jgi:hypothetical protein
MPGVFISHSSDDKDFIFRLALDLLNAGFPVWLDAYQMEIGSKLRPEIYEGIDQSTHLILVISESSIKSDWVKKELNRALKKEKEINHPFILPIKLGKCAEPIGIRGRIYANFTDEYFPALEQLEKVLRKRGADSIQTPFEKQLIPIKLDQSVFVDEVSLRKRLSLLPFTTESRFTPEQFVVSPDPVYNKLKANLLRNLQRIKDDPNVTRQERLYLTASYEDIKKYEHTLESGLARIANFIADRGWNPLRIAESIYWFVRICRNQTLVSMWAAQKTNDPNLVTPGPHIKKNLFHRDEETKEFFEADELHEYAIFRMDNGNEVTSLITDKDSFIDDYLEEFKGDLNFNMPLVDVSPENLYKFVIPQVYYYKYFSEGWSIEESRIRRR